jgi:hypothetical protein
LSTPTHKDYFLPFLMLMVGMLLFASCKKDKDEEFPKVNYLTPLENAIYQVGDTIHLEAVISDNQSIVSVEVELTDVNFVPVLKSYSPPVKGNPMTLVFDYPLDDYFMESGTYNLLIKVNDGNLVKHKYQRLTIGGVKRELIALAVEYFCAARHKLIILDSGFQRVTQVDESLFGISGMDAMPYHNRLAYVFEGEDMLKVYDYKKHNPVWMKDYSNVIGETVYGVFAAEKSFLAFFDWARIKQFDIYGNVKGDIQDSLQLPMHMLELSNFYLSASMYQKSPFYHSIRSYLKNGLVNYQNYSLDFPITRMFDMGQDRVLLLGNKNNEGQIRIYNIVQHSMTKPRDLNGELIIDAVQINQDFYLLRLGDNLMKYDAGANTLSTWEAQAPWNNLSYDPINHALIFSLGNEIRMIDMASPNRQLIYSNTITCTSGIQNLIPLYNR